MSVENLADRLTRMEIVEKRLKAALEMQEANDKAISDLYQFTEKAAAAFQALADQNKAITDALVQLMSAP